MFQPVQKKQGNTSDKIMQQVAQWLQQQVPPQQIMQQLQKMGVQPQQAQQMIQAVAQQMQQQSPQQSQPQQAPPQQGQPQMQQGGRAAMDNTFHKFSDNNPGLNETLKNERLGTKSFNSDNFQPNYNFGPIFSKSKPNSIDSIDYRYNFNNAKKLFTKPYDGGGTELGFQLNKSLPSSYIHFSDDDRYKNNRNELLDAVTQEEGAYKDWLGQAKGKYYDGSENLKKEYNATGMPKMLSKMQQGGYNSVADYSKASGRDGSFSGRKQLASQLGISDYSGTAQQNQMLMQKLQQQDNQSRSFQRQESVTNPETGAEEDIHSNNIQELNVVKQQRLQAIKDHYDQLQKQQSNAKQIPLHNPKKPEEIAYQPSNEERLRPLEEQPFIQHDFNPLELYHYTANSLKGQNPQQTPPRFSSEEESNEWHRKSHDKLGILGSTILGLGATAAGIYGLPSMQNFLQNTPEYLQNTNEFKQGQETLINQAFNNSKYKPRFVINSEGKPLLKGVVESSMFTAAKEVKGPSAYSQMPLTTEVAKTITNPYTTVQLPKGVNIPEEASKLKQGWNAAKEVLAGSKFLKGAKNIMRFQEGGDFDTDNYNPYLSDNDSDNQMMKGGSHRMMQSGGKLNYADFTPDRTILSRNEIYKGSNPDMMIFQDTYGDGRKDITYQNRKTGQLMANPWGKNLDNSVNPNITGTLDIEKPMFKPLSTVSKMKRGGMKKWNY